MAVPGVATLPAHCSALGMVLSHPGLRENAPVNLVPKRSYRTPQSLRRWPSPHISALPEAGPWTRASCLGQCSAHCCWHRIYSGHCHLPGGLPVSAFSETLLLGAQTLLILAKDTPRFGMLFRTPERSSPSLWIVACSADVVVLQVCSLDLQRSHRLGAG